MNNVVGRKSSLARHAQTVDVRMFCYSDVNSAFFVSHELRLLLPLSVMMMQLKQKKLVIVPRRGMVPKKAKYT